MKERRYQRIGTWVVILSALIILAVTYVPFVYVVANSFKDGAQFLEQPMAILWTFHWQNYVEAWRGIGLYLGNTVIVGILSAVVSVAIAVPASYFFAEIRVPGKNLIFTAFVGLLLIPWVLTIIPLYLEAHYFRIDNTWLALIFPYAAGSQPMFVYLFRTFFEGIPKELYESARLDGAGEWKVLLRIVAPLSVPILMTGSILVFNSVWGDYLWPQLVLNNYHLFTVSAGLQLFVSQLSNTYTSLGLSGVGPEFAAYVIAMLPIIALIIVTMKFFIQGVTSGSVKG